MGGGGGGGGLRDWGRKCTYMNKCLKWHFDSSRRTPVQNNFEIHAYIYIYELWPRKAPLYDFQV